MPQSNGDVVDTTIKAAGGLGVLFAALRFAFKTWKSDKRDVSLIEAEIASLKRLKEEVIEWKDLAATLSKKLAKLRALELEGASDIAVLGVYLETIDNRECHKMQSYFKCPADDVLKDVMEVYKRVIDRRTIKRDILNEELK